MTNMKEFIELYKIEREKIKKTEGYNLYLGLCITYFIILIASLVVSKMVEKESLRDIKERLNSDDDFFDIDFDKEEDL